MSDYRWFDVGNGRHVFRRVREPNDRRSNLPIPTLIRDFDEPVQSMANGQWYTSKRALAASHKASGNPHGQDFIELGNEDVKFAPHETSERELRDDIRSALSDVRSGILPPVLTLDD